jgi:hypothetical protein
MTNAPELAEEAVTGRKLRWEPAAQNSVWTPTARRGGIFGKVVDPKINEALTRAARLSQVESPVEIHVIDQSSETGIQ